MLWLPHQISVVIKMWALESDKSKFKLGSFTPHPQQACGLFGLLQALQAQGRLLLLCQETLFLQIPLSLSRRLLKHHLVTELLLPSLYLKSEDSPSQRHNLAPHYWALLF